MLFIERDHLPSASLVQVKAIKPSAKLDGNRTTLSGVPLANFLRSCHIFSMIFRASRYILIVLLAFTFIGGTFAQAVSVTVSSNCSQTMMQMDGVSSVHTDHVIAASDHQKTPMKPMPADCVDQMGCLSVPMLGAQLTGHSSPVNYSKTIYSLSNSSSDGLSPQPVVFPPIGA